ncbi:MAG: hypothetical protein F4X27_04215 [Chloroflexi bacterium]|nr:hypothetical protein [Chloroflexota bacterium]
MALIAAGVLASLVAVVGVFWFGWYETRQNRELLVALPVYPGAEVVQDFPHASESDENPLTPPDKWVILRAYRVPVGATGEEVAGFYMDNMPPEWERCLRHASTYEPETGEEGVEFTGVAFIRERERTFMSVDVLGMESGRRQYGVYLERDLEPHIDPCEPQRLALPCLPGRSGPPEFRPTPVPTFPPGMTEEERFARGILACWEIKDNDFETNLMEMFPEAGDLGAAKARFIEVNSSKTMEELDPVVDRHCPPGGSPPP